MSQKWPETGQKTPLVAVPLTKTIQINIFGYPKNEFLI